MLRRMDGVIAALKQAIVLSAGGVRRQGRCICEGRNAEDGYLIERFQVWTSEPETQYHILLTNPARFST